MTTLSIEKFQQFIEPYGFIISKFFSDEQRCIFIELCTVRGVRMICSVSTNYIFKLSNHECVKIKKIIVENDNDSKKEDLSYYTQQDEQFIEEKYSDPNLQHNHTISTINKISMKEHLHSTYKHKVLLKNMESVEQINIKNIQRQCARLKYCIQGLQHKLMISHYSYLGLLDEDDNIQIYMNENNSKKRDMHIVVDLKIFIDKIKSIEDEVVQLQKGVFSILNCNQVTHIKNIKNLLENKENFQTQSENLFSLKNELLDKIERFSILLQENNELQKDKEIELHHIMSTHGNNTAYFDIKVTHKKENISKQLDKLKKMQADMLKIITNLNNEYANIGLLIDTVLFNNIVMLDQIFKNLSDLDNLKIKEKK